MPIQEGLFFFNGRRISRKEVWTFQPVTPDYAPVGIAGSFTVTGTGINVLIEADITFAKGNGSQDFSQNNAFVLAVDGNILPASFKRLPANYDVSLIGNASGRGTLRTVVTLNGGVHTVGVRAIAQAGNVQYIFSDCSITLTEAKSADNV